MALHKLVRRNYCGKSLVSIKYENLHSFKEGVILLCQNILETRRISHLHGSVLFVIPLSTLFSVFHYLHLLLSYMQQLTISLCCFSQNFLTPKLLSPQYLGLQSILCRLDFLIDTISLHYF